MYLQWVTPKEQGVPNISGPLAPHAFILGMFHSWIITLYFLPHYSCEKVCDIYIYPLGTQHSIMIVDHSPMASLMIPQPYLFFWSI